MNLTAAFLCSREAIKVMKGQTPQGGRIINIGSVSAKTPRPDSLPYTATKFALQGMTHQLTMDGRKYGVVASILHPGATLSSFSTRRGQTKAGPGTTPDDYVMAAEDVAKIVVLMCSLPPEVNCMRRQSCPITCAHSSVAVEWEAWRPAIRRRLELLGNSPTASTRPPAFAHAVIWRVAPRGGEETAGVPGAGPPGGIMEGGAPPVAPSMRCATRRPHRGRCATRRPHRGRCAARRHHRGRCATRRHHRGRGATGGIIEGGEPRRHHRGRGATRRHHKGRQAARRRSRRRRRHLCRRGTVKARRAKVPRARMCMGVLP